MMDYFGAVGLQTYAPLLGVVLLVFIMMRLTARKQRQSGPTSQSHARDHLAKLKEEHAVKGDMQELMVELQDLSRDINAQIDTRFAKLEVSIRAADERIDILERLLRTADGRPTIDTVVSGDDEAAPLPQEQPQAGLPELPHGRIYDLADGGKNSIQIAQETGRTPGEIELILSLRESTRSP
ncbi:MAG: hypothetical protein IIB58_11870 [Planctomycetes bacterium]|nr:hypothetical protein [Planctomycetota bacterium]